MYTCFLPWRGEELEREVPARQDEGQRVLPLAQVAGALPARPAHQAGPGGGAPARGVEQLLCAAGGGRGENAQDALLQHHPATQEPF